MTYPMIRIDDMPDEEFFDLAQEVLGNGPICPLCALETARQGISDLLHATPKRSISGQVRHELALLMHVLTGALVTARAADIGLLEDDDIEEHTKH